MGLVTSILFFLQFSQKSARPRKGRYTQKRRKNRSQDQEQPLGDVRPKKFELHKISKRQNDRKG